MAVCLYVCARIQAERQSQQQWERELQERERRLKQQEEAFGRLSGLEEMLHTRILAVEEVRHTQTPSSHIQHMRCVIQYISSPHLVSAPSTLPLSGSNSVVLNHKLPNHTTNHTA